MVSKLDPGSPTTAFTSIASLKPQYALIIDTTDMKATLIVTMLSIQFLNAACREDTRYHDNQIMFASFPLALSGFDQTVYR